MELPAGGRQPGTPRAQDFWNLDEGRSFIAGSRPVQDGGVNVLEPEGLRLGHFDPGEGAGLRILPGQSWGRGG
jgi:hypothetical protein